MSERDLVCAVTAMRGDLRRAGVPPFVAEATLAFYRHALAHPSAGAWRSFYRSVHRRLHELTLAEYPLPPGDARPLLALLDDDLGAALYAEHERARIRAALVEEGSCREARLSS